MLGSIAPFGGVFPFFLLLGSVGLFPPFPPFIVDVPSLELLGLIFGSPPTIVEEIFFLILSDTFLIILTFFAFSVFGV